MSSISPEATTVVAPELLGSMTTKGQMKPISWQGESHAFGAGSNSHTFVGCACLNFSYIITWFYSVILYLSFTLIPATVFANKYTAILHALSCLWPELHCVSCSLSRIMQCCLIICSNATWQYQICGSPVTHSDLECVVGETGAPIPNSLTHQTCLGRIPCFWQNVGDHHLKSYKSGPTGYLVQR